MGAAKVDRSIAKLDPVCTKEQNCLQPISFAHTGRTGTLHTKNMADSFDLLDELGDEKKVNELKARIQKKKASDVISKLDSIESEIESYWMAKLGPPDGYFPIIEGFRRDIISIQACLTAFKEVLAELGRNSVPSESQISRCLTFQTLLLRQFALPRWSRWRAPLLSGRYTRFLGACLVPPLSVFDGATSAAPPRGADAATLCTRDFMNRSVTFLSSRLSMLL